MLSGGSRRDIPSGAVLASAGSAMAVRPRQPVAMMPLNGVEQELPTLNPAPPRVAPLEGRYWRGRWTMGRASARCGTRKLAW